MSNFLQTLQSLKGGGYAWTDSAQVRVGLEKILSKPYISETYASLTDTNIALTTDGITPSKTVTFTAPVDCTIRNLVFFPVHQTTVADDPTNMYSGTLLDINYAGVMYFGQITVAGSGPDTGTYVDGSGVPCGIFSLHNIIDNPQLNYRLAAGDTLSLTLWAFGVQGRTFNPYQLVAFYDEGFDTTVTPRRWIGTASTATFVTSTAALTGAGAATGTITVTAASVSGGDTIRLASETSFGSDLIFAGGTLTGQSGGGASGNRTWDSDITGITNIRDAILSALQDNANPWTGAWSFAASSTDAITVSRQREGLFGNFDEFEITATNISATPSTGTLSGSVAALDTAVGGFQAPSVDMNIDTIWMGNFISSAVEPSAYFLDTPSLHALRVGGSPVTGFPPAKMWGEAKTWKAMRGSEDVTASTAVSLDIRNPNGAGFLILCMSGTAT